MNITVHITQKCTPVDRKYTTCVDFGQKIMKHTKLEAVDHVKASKYKNVFAKI